MIGQFLSNTNESATVLILQNFLELNKASLSIPAALDFQTKKKRKRKILLPWSSTVLGASANWKEDRPRRITSPRFQLLSPP